MLTANKPAQQAICFQTGSDRKARRPSRCARPFDPAQARFFIRGRESAAKK